MEDEAYNNIYLYNTAKWAAKRFNMDVKDLVECCEIEDLSDMVL